MTRPRQAKDDEKQAPQHEAVVEPAERHDEHSAREGGKDGYGGPHHPLGPEPAHQETVELRAADERDGIGREDQAVGRRAEAEMLDEHHRRTRQIGKEARLAETADEDEANKPAILQQAR